MFYCLYTDQTKDSCSPEDHKKGLWCYAPVAESSNDSCDLDTQTSSSNPESPQEHNKNGAKIDKQGVTSLYQTDKSGSQSSDSDKGLFTKGCKSEMKQLKKPEPPPKPTFIKHLRDDAARAGVMGSPALRQLRTGLNTIERLSFKGDNSGSSFTTESSSGSEQDAIHGMQRPAFGKQRNLRKTKSRGKGKGSVNLTGSLLDELDTEDKDLEQYECDVHYGQDNVESTETPPKLSERTESSNSSTQSDIANQVLCDKRPNDSEPITEQDTSEPVKYSVKDSIKAFEKRLGNS